MRARMFLTRQLTVTLLTAAFGMAQEPVAMKYSGTPLQLPYECNEDDIEWAGMLCTEQEPCPIFLELSAVGSAGQKVFAGGDLHSSTTSLYSVLLQSDDAGATW